MEVIFFVLFSCFSITMNVMIRKDCPIDEIHRSCSFFDEYTCWTKADRTERVMTELKRLVHCKSGCFCKRGYVREFPNGSCIATVGCRDQRLKMLIEKIPTIETTFNYE